MEIPLTQGFKDTIGDILQCCAEGKTDSCRIALQVREGRKLVVDMTFSVEIGEADE